MTFPKKSAGIFLSGLFGQFWQRRLAGWDRASHQAGGSHSSEPENPGQGGLLPAK